MLSGRVGVVLGVANKHSLAWAVAKVRAHGCSSLPPCLLQLNRDGDPSSACLLPLCLLCSALHRKAWHAAGARVVVTCQGPRFLSRLEGLIHAAVEEQGMARPAGNGTGGACGHLTAACCDVAQDAEVEQLFEEHVGAGVVFGAADGNDGSGGGLDMVFHSVAHAPTAALKGRFLDTTRDDFLAAHDVRCALSRQARASRIFTSSAGT